MYKLADLAMKELKVVMGAVLISQVYTFRLTEKDHSMIFVNYMYKDSFLKVSLKKCSQPSERNTIHYIKIIQDRCWLIYS